MLGISRYILRQLLVGTALTGIGLACVLWLTQSLRFVELIVTKGLSIFGFLKLTLMLLPNFLAYIMPVALFVVVLFVYNKMNTDRELVVLRAAGLSTWALGRPALGLALVATLLAYGITTLLTPLSNQAFREYHWAVRHDLSALLIQEGSFNHLAPGLTLFVQDRTGAGELRNVMLYDERVPDKVSTVMAERGVLMKGEDGPRVLLENGNRQEVTAEDGRMSMLYFDRYTVEVEIAGSRRGSRGTDVRERPTSELLWPEPGAFDTRQLREMTVEAHQRLTVPLHNLSFVAIALACLLTGSFNRRGQTGRVLAAVGLMILVEAGALAGAQLVSRNPQLAWLLYANALLPIAGGAYMLLGPPSRRLAVPGSRRAAPDAA